MKSNDMDKNQKYLDKSAISVVSLEKADDDLQYWLSQTPMERLAALELNRRLVYGYDRATSRLQRFLEVAELERG
jgi:hypothetical protein